MQVIVQQSHPGITFHRHKVAVSLSPVLSGFNALHGSFVVILSLSFILLLLYNLFRTVWLQQICLLASLTEVSSGSSAILLEIYQYVNVSYGISTISPWNLLSYPVVSSIFFYNHQRNFSDTVWLWVLRAWGSVPKFPIICKGCEFCTRILWSIINKEDTRNPMPCKHVFQASYDWSAVVRQFTSKLFEK